MRNFVRFTFHIGKRQLYETDPAPLYILPFSSYLYSNSVLKEVDLLFINFFALCLVVFIWVFFHLLLRFSIIVQFFRYFLAS